MSDGAGTGAALMARKKAGISKRLRFEVFKRDGFVCQYCGNHPPAVVLHFCGVCWGRIRDMEDARA